MNVYPSLTRLTFMPGSGAGRCSRLYRVVVALKELGTSGTPRSNPHSSIGFPFFIGDNRVLTRMLPLLSPVRATDGHEQGISSDQGWKVVADSISRPPYGFGR